MSKLGGYMRWVETMLQVDSAERRHWVNEIIDGFRSLRKGARDKNVRYLSDVLEEENEFQLIGFVPKIEYIKVEGPEEHMNVLWEHQHMNPVLLYKHKTLPVLILAGPGLKWDRDSGIHG